MVQTYEEDGEMDDHKKKIQERSRVDMTRSDSRTVMCHCAAQTQTARSF